MPSRNRDAFHRVKMEGALLRLQGRSNPSRELAELARVQVPGPMGTEEWIPGPMGTEEWILLEQQAVAQRQALPLLPFPRLPFPRLPIDENENENGR